jgi:hypothetical protein
LIKISQFIAQKSEDVGEIKEGIQKAGERLLDLHLTVEKNQFELRSTMDSYQDKIDEQYLRFEKGEQSKSPPHYT